MRQFSIVIVTLLLFASVNSQFDDAKIDWVCEVDGTQSANDLEAQSCKYAPPTSGQDRDQQGGQCQSCLVSEQPVRESSGVLIPTVDFVCMKRIFEVPTIHDDGVPNFEQRPVLCPGRYRIASCETNEADYDYRVERVREAVLSVRGITDDCKDENGLRLEISPCQTNFPRYLELEKAARLEATGSLVAQRNPATYETRYITSCIDLTEFLVETLVGCESKEARGVISPMSAAVWCQTIDWRPAGDKYHATPAELPAQMTARRRREIPTRKITRRSPRTVSS